MMKRVFTTAAPCYRFLRRLKNRMLNLADPPVIVLAYHRVTVLDSDPHQLAVTPDNFRSQMQYLRQNFHCVRMDEDWSGLREPAVAVTFDDGYADNLYEALPILEEAKVPATFFISTGIIGSNAEFWFDDLERLVLGDGARPPFFVLSDREHGGSWPTVELQQRQALHDLLHCLMLTLKASRREDWLDQLRRWARIGQKGREAYRALTREELRTLAASTNVTIGAHGLTHTPLALLRQEEQRREIIVSRNELEKLVGRTVAVFSYPFGGRGHYDHVTRRLCRESGIFRAVTTFSGQVHRWTDPWQIPRQLVRNWDVNTFADSMERFWA